MGIRPYEVTKVISPWAYWVKLPNQLCIHDIQPICCVEKVAQDPLPHQQHEPPPPAIIDGEEQHEVERIDDSLIFQR